MSSVLQIPLSSEPPKVCLLDYAIPDLKQYFVTLGEKPFRAEQMLRWVFKRGILDPAQMTDMSLKARAHLSACASLSFPEVIWDQTCADGTRKWLLKLADGNAIETVFIPEEGRGTLCVSSQVGCGLNCTFCSTAKQGFNRHLTLSEILGQMWQADWHLKRDLGLEHPITNVVFMGMGEPLLNTSAVFAAVEILLHDWAYGLSKYRVTISTSGVVPEIYRLTRETQAALAISLHAPNDALRSQLVPINKRYPLAELMPACVDYVVQDPRRNVLFEYVMLKGVNDSLSQARELSQLFKTYCFPGERSVKINLIPFNPFPQTSYETSDPETVLKFQSVLKKDGWITTIRKTRGKEKDAACGQLVGQFKDRTSRSRLYQEKLKGTEKDNS